MTGFRVVRGGAQALYGVTPDLTTLGKVIGGGLPVGAYGGRRGIMDLVAPAGPVYQAGTLSGNPLAMAAGIETLRTLADPGIWDGLERTGAAARGRTVPLGRRRSGRACRDDVRPVLLGRPVTSWGRRNRRHEPLRRLPRRDARPRRLSGSVAVRGGLPLDGHADTEIDADIAPATRRLRAPIDSALRFAAVKVLLVTMYFPPAGGGECSARSSSPSTYRRSASRRTSSPRTIRSGCTAIPISRADAGVDPPCALPRPARHASPPRSFRPPRARPRRRAGTVHGATPAASRRERDLEPDRHPGGTPDRAE